MPTKNPRLTITMTPALSAQLRRLSELTGNSQGSLIAELLETSGPVFERLINLLEAAKEAKHEMQDSFRADLAAAQTKVEAQLGLSLETLDTATRPLLEQVEKIRRRARRGGVVKAQPSRAAAPKLGVSTPISNRGVRLKVKTSNPPVKAGGK